MNPLGFLNAPAIYVEFGQNSLKMLDGDDGLELSLDRQENGRITPACEERLISSLRVFLKKHQWRPRVRAVCAIGARGVSIRRLTLPASSREETERLLPLQIEREFPLLPEELAWGHRPLNAQRLSGNGEPRSDERRDSLSPTGGEGQGEGASELLVVAVKRDVIDNYTNILSACGLEPVFTLGALARSSLCRDGEQTYALLDINRNHSELISFENGVPTTIRIFPWGKESIHGSADGAALESFARSLDPKAIGQKLYLTGESAKDLSSPLTRMLGVKCEPIDITAGEGRSAAISALKKSCEENGAAEPLLLLHAKTGKEAESAARTFQWKWAALAALLALTCFSLRYAEAFVRQPSLAKRLTALKASRENFPKIDRELSFLQYLKTNQAPYLDPLSAMANAAASGTRIETLSMNRHGDLSLRASMRDAQQVSQFRAKLIESGLFSTIVIEEQTPSADRQKLTVRMTGQWNPLAEHKSPRIEPSNRPPILPLPAGEGRDEGEGAVRMDKRERSRPQTHGDGKGEGVQNGPSRPQEEPK